MIRLITANTPKIEGPRNLAVIILLGMASMLPMTAEKDIMAVSSKASFFCSLIVRIAYLE